MHPRGRFIYRLAGRDRQKSASYYTPESLTRCVVKYALRELIPDDMPADRILDLTVCEPAMGSAAFLNEAVNQLAEKYLERKQREQGKRIPHAEYADELQQVKHYIADRNVYGVDLNPVARELAEVSLWLNSIHRGGHVPWFGYQLVCGNSLVGARRQVFPTAKLGKKNRKPELWFNHVAGARRAASQRRNRKRADTDSATCATPRRPAPRTAPPAPSTISCCPTPAWPPTATRRPRRSNRSASSASRSGASTSSSRSPRTRSPSSKRSPTAWTPSGRSTQNSSPATTGRPRTRCRSGAAACPGRRTPHHQHLEGSHPQSGRLQREHPDRQPLPPSEVGDGLLVRPLVLADPGSRSSCRTATSSSTTISLVLAPDPCLPARRRSRTRPLDLFGAEYADHAKDIADRITDEVGMLDLEQAVRAVRPRLKFVDDLARRHRFHHWELAFADLFYGERADGSVRGGFDLVLGNPPWIKVEWEEAGVLGDHNPAFVLRRHIRRPRLRGAA